MIASRAEMTASDNASSFVELRRELNAVLDAHIPRGTPVALLMFPYDGNVGNHMMWIAICDYLQERGSPIGYAAHANNFNVLDVERAIGTGPILFSGGVTVSRLWPQHAQMKRVVARSFPRNALVSLPSTMLFVDDDDRDAARDMFGAHPNVTVLARDPVSYGQARSVFPESVRVVTSPDLGFRLPPQPIVGRPVHDIIWLARDDVEQGVGPPPDGVHVFDWTHALQADVPRCYYLLRLSGFFSRLRSTVPGGHLSRFLSGPMASLYERASRYVLDYGNRVLDAGRVLVTDRLHPHVLAALRGQPVVLLPDKFGKNRAVFDYSSRFLPGVHWADRTDQAFSMARELATSAAGHDSQPREPDEIDRHHGLRTAGSPLSLKSTLQR